MTAYAGCDDQALVSTYAADTSIGCPPKADFDYPPVIGCPPVGIDPDGHSYGEVAARAVNSVHAQHQSPFYGYIRSGVHQKIYLFPLLEDAKQWFDQHMQLEPAHDYAAVFTATDLRGPISGMEHFNTAGYMGPNQAQALIGQWMDLQSPEVGNWLLPVLGIPLGALGGYYLRKWQEQNPGKTFPLIGEDTEVGRWGGHVGYQVGGPWMDLVGAQAQQQADVVRRAEWPQTRALIQSAIAEVSEFAASNPAEAYVWSLDAPSRAPYAGSTPGSVVILEGTTNIVPFSTGAQALTYLREVAQSQPVALAMFERSTGHWPNPTAWRKSSDPADAQVIAQHIASRSGTQMSGTYLGGPWMDLVGAQAQQQADVVRRAEWPHTRALIQSAIDEVKEAAASQPAEAYVWTLEEPGPSTRPGVVLEPTTTIVPFSTRDAALAYLREVSQQQPIAQAMFERSSPHWPNPTAWRKSSDPDDAPLIAQHIARRSTTQMSGTYLGADPAVSTAILAVRRRAQQLADRRAGAVVGVIHTSKDGMWHTLAFRNEDDADDWITIAAQSPETYTYAAYFNKNAPQWPRAVIEKISGGRPPPGTGLPRRTTHLGAALDDNRARGKQLASAKRANAVGAIRAADGLWHVYGLTSLDDAIDWLQLMTREKARFIYAAAYEKARDGTAVIQDEEFGTARALPAVSGWAA